MKRGEFSFDSQLARLLHFLVWQSRGYNDSLSPLMPGGLITKETAYSWLLSSGHLCKTVNRHLGHNVRPAISSHSLARVSMAFLHKAPLNFLYYLLRLTDWPTTPMIPVLDWVGLVSMWGSNREPQCHGSHPAGNLSFQAGSTMTGKTHRGQWHSGQ